MHRAMKRRVHWKVLVLGSALAMGAPVVAQEAAPEAGGAPGVKTPAKPAKTAAAPASDSGLKQRVEQLEEQIVDLQVVIGTLESLAKSPGSSGSTRPAYAASPAGADNGRIQSLETQLKALTQQVEQLAANVRANGAGASAVQVPNAALRTDAATAARPEPAPELDKKPYMSGNDPIGAMIGEPLPEVQEPGVAAVAPTGEDPKTAYEAAYGYMLQQDYGSAQTGFAAFLKNNPNHALVPNALYWLGETYYVQRNYADAAEAFDIVLAAHASSNKAPDSQLKKAMSLSQLGKNAEACAALKLLGTKYPTAPVHVKTKADSERRRVGCS